jgi:hypothetical protein
LLFIDLLVPSFVFYFFIKFLAISINKSVIDVLALAEHYIYNIFLFVENFFIYVASIIGVVTKSNLLPTNTNNVFCSAYFYTSPTQKF